MRDIQIISFVLLAVLGIVVCSGTDAKSAINAPKPQATEKSAKTEQTASNNTKSRVILRKELESKLPALEAAYNKMPEDNTNRRSYADLLFKLGNIWQVKDVIAPLATPQSSNIDDLTIGAWSAYMTGSYDRAEVLFLRIKELCSRGSETEKNAVLGLLQTYYQTNRYDKAKAIPIPAEDGKAKELFTLMSRFRGNPYQTEWASPDKVAHIPIINDFMKPATLPRVRIEVNGHPLECILDTGADQLIITERFAAKLGLSNIMSRQAKYASTKGKSIEEQIGVADIVKLDKAILRNVPVVYHLTNGNNAEPAYDGIISTQLLKQFLSTVDYDKKEITLRERSTSGKKQFLEAFGNGDPVRIQFWLSSTHLMFAKGSINGRTLNMLVDSGLAASMPMVVVNETVDDLNLTSKKTAIEGTQYYWVPIQSYGLGPLICGSTQTLGNVMVDEDIYWKLHSIFDAVISNKYLRQFGSWTIDFDTMNFYFPADSAARAAKSLNDNKPKPITETKKTEPGKLEDYAGSYEVAPGIALEITTADGVVFIQAPGQPKVGMEAADNDKFLIQLAGAKIEFRRDSNGVVTTLLLDQNGHSTKAEKKK
jgi:hypothetical protein